MPSILRAHVHAARGLPVMDTASKLADSYVEVIFGQLHPRRTEVVRKTLNPEFDTEFKLEITDDSSLLTEPVIFNVMDRDYITDDPIGTVAISLEPLLCPFWGCSTTDEACTNDPDKPKTVSGWFPIYDTLEGIRGELLVSLRLSFFGDLSAGMGSKLHRGLPTIGSRDEDSLNDDASDAMVRSGSLPADSSTNEHAFATINTTGGGSSIAFFASDRLDPALFPMQILLGFVEELVVEDDPEYALTYSLSSVADSYRSARKSNEERQLLLHRLAYRLRASISNKVQSAGGNAVIGYHQHFDIEGDSGVVARAYGTAAMLSTEDATSSAFQKHFGERNLASIAESILGYFQEAGHDADRQGRKLSTPTDEKSGQMSPQGRTPKLLPSPGGAERAGAEAGAMPLLSLENPLSPGPAGSVLPLPRSQVRAVLKMNEPIPADLALHVPVHHNFIRRITQPDDVQIFTVGQLPPNVRMKVGGLIGARSVKYLGRLHAKAYDQETRDRWWGELREELRSHAAKLSCSQIIGYSETAQICGDACVLSVIGTAVQLRNANSGTSTRSRRHRRRLVKTAEPTVKVPFAPGHLFGPIEPPEEPLSNATVVHHSEISPAIPSPELVISNHGSLRPWYLSAGGPAVAVNLAADIKRRLTSNTRPPQLITPGNPTAEQSPCLDAGWDSADPFFDRDPRHSACSVLHVPNEHRSAFNNTKLYQCRSCKRHWVPNVVLATVEIPPNLVTSGPGMLIEARVARRKDKSTGEAECVRLSEELLFTEFQMHQQLLLKLRLIGRNGVFGIRSTVHFNGSLILGVMTGTAVLIPALPAPVIPTFRRFGTSTKASDEIVVRELQRTAVAHRDLLTANRDRVSRAYASCREISVAAMKAVDVCMHRYLKLLLENYSGTIAHIQLNAAAVLESTCKDTPERRRRGALKRRNSKRWSSRHQTVDDSSSESETHGGRRRRARSRSTSTASSELLGVDRRARRRRRRSSSSISTSTTESSDTETSSDSSSDRSTDSSTSSSETSSAEGSVSESDEERQNAADDGMTHYVVEMDDDQLEDMQLALGDFVPPEGIALLNTQAPPSICTPDGPAIAPTQRFAFFDTPKRISSIFSELEEFPRFEDNFLQTASCRSLQPEAIWMPVVVLRVRWVDLAGAQPSYEMAVDASQGLHTDAKPDGGRAPTHASGGSFLSGVAQAFGFGSSAASTNPGGPTVNAGHGDTRSVSESEKLARLFKAAYSVLVYKVRLHAPCTICSVRSQLSIPEPEVVELVVTGMVIKESSLLLEDFKPAITSGGAEASLQTINHTMTTETSMMQTAVPPVAVQMIQSSMHAKNQQMHAEARCFVSWLEAMQTGKSPTLDVAAKAARGVALRTILHAPTAGAVETSWLPSLKRGRDPSSGTAPSEPETASDGEDDSEDDADERQTNKWRARDGASVASSQATGTDRPAPHFSRSVSAPRAVTVLPQYRPSVNARTSREVCLSPLSYVPGARVKRYIGCVNMNFIRETMAVRQGGGLSSFQHTFIAEANAILRSQAAALGGNGVLCYRLVPRESGGKSARNQAYHLMSLSGDVVELEVDH